VQELYRFAGVTSGEPNSENSRAFFAWLCTQSAATVQSHLEMVVRHLGHDRSVRTWWEVYPQLACVAVEVKGEYRLVSLSDVRRYGGRVFLPDDDDLVQSIRRAHPNARVLLAVTSHPRVLKPISEILRSVGARSLRDAASSPVNVRGEDGSVPDENRRNMLVSREDLKLFFVLVESAGLLCRQGSILREICSATVVEARKFWFGDHLAQQRAPLLVSAKILEREHVGGR
jgi:hypothetical protein